MRKGTKKNNVTLREKPLASGSLSLYLDIYRDGIRSYEFLKLYILAKPRTPIDRQKNKETLELAETIRTKRESELIHTAYGEVVPVRKNVSFFAFADKYQADYTKKDIRMITGAINRFRSFIEEKHPTKNPGKLLFSQIDKIMIAGFVPFSI